MNILLPITIINEMFGAGTSIPAVDASVGEVGWVSGTAYVVGDRRIDVGYTYLFGNLSRSKKYTATGLPMRPGAELDITLTQNDPLLDAELGFLAVGQWQQLLAPLRTNLGGTQYGAEVTPKSYSYFKQAADGTYIRRKGRVAKAITASVVIDARDAPRVAALLEKILDIPVAIEASSLPKYGHISTVGFVTGSVVSESWGIARVNLKVDGNI